MALVIAYKGKGGIKAIFGKREEKMWKICAPL